jgi:hypothetical protein
LIKKNKVSWGKKRKEENFGIKKKKYIFWLNIFFFAFSPLVTGNTCLHTTFMENTIGKVA